LENPMTPDLQILAQLRLDDLRREGAMVALAAQLRDPSRPGYRQRMAHWLRAFARRVEPAYEAQIGREAWLTHS
jgi:hypothetical protein